MKRCGKCQEEKPLDSFGPNRATSDGLQSRCRQCCKEYAREYRKTPKQKAYNNAYKKQSHWRSYYKSDAWKKYHKNASLIRVYGITLEQYTQMLHNQDGRCAICRRLGSELPKALAVDHCHASGRVRELLCHPCNQALGLFKENLDALNSAIAYLERHRCPNQEKT